MQQIILKTDIANDIVSSLDILWKLRTIRNDDWIDILNLLQGVLKKEIFENFSKEKINGILKIITILQLDNTTSSNVSLTLEILSKSGFNPWRPLSHET